MLAASNYQILLIFISNFAKKLDNGLDKTFQVLQCHQVNQLKGQKTSKFHFQTRTFQFLFHYMDQL